LLELLLLPAATLAVLGYPTLSGYKGLLGSGVKELPVELERFLVGLEPLFCCFYLWIFGPLNFAERLVSFSKAKSN
jgi:hypothetical protein